MAEVSAAPPLTEDFGTSPSGGEWLVFRSLVGHLCPFTHVGVALADAFKCMVVGLFHHLVLGQSTELLRDGAAVFDKGISAVHPTRSDAAEFLLQHFPQVTGEDIALDERVAIVGDAHGAVEMLAVFQGGIEMVHFRGCGTVVINLGHAWMWPFHLRLLRSGT